MDRRSILSALGATVPLAGCVIPRGGTAAVRERFDGEPTRPECDVESERVEVDRGDGETRVYETAATIPYPDPPTEFTDDTLLEFVDAFESAYVSHSVLCDRSDRVIDLANRVRERELLDWYSDITIVFLSRFAGASHGVGDDGSEWYATEPPSGVGYAVDETGAARVRAETYDVETYESRGADPLEDGELVAVFD